MITSEVIVAFSVCPRKAHLLLQGDQPRITSDYTNVINHRKKLNQVKHGFYINDTYTTVTSQNTTQFSQETITNARIVVDDLEALCDMLTKCHSLDGISYYEPTICIGTYNIQKEQILFLAFAGHVLGQVQGHLPSIGRIISMSGKVHKVKLQKSYDQIGKFVSLARKWVSESKPEIAPVALNEHCPYCYYESHCREIAEDKNDITLLNRVTPKVARKYNKKGIFTIEQLSYLFKSRKSKKEEKKNLMSHKPELQALAIRSRKTYVHVIPHVSRQSVELFLDIEGIPDQEMFYLVGLLVSKEGSEEFYSFWANSGEDEKYILLKLIDKLQAYPDAPIYHYGSYESRFFSKMAKRYALELENISSRLKNLSTLIHGKIYFPVRSNSLKDIAGLAGAKWSASNATGLQSLVWRYLWEEDQQEYYKRLLIAYNREDCYAVKKLLIELVRIGTSADQAEDIDFPDNPKQYATERGTQIHEDFAQILRSAHSGYERSKIKIREGSSQKNSKKRGGKKGHQGYTRKIPKARKVVSIPSRKECPKCENSPLRTTQKVIETTVTDINFSRNGCKKSIIKYTSFYGYCRKCTKEYAPVELSGAGRLRVLGHGLRTWVVYHRVILRLPYRSIIQSLEDQFKETISDGTVVCFIKDFAEYYTETKKKIEESIFSSPYVHIDETKINIQGKTHYVWVFTNGDEVFFEMTRTRETEIVHRKMSGYTGVVVSDFYGGYDSVNCIQQKCLVHLIRDMNEDLWKHPFDKEFEQLVGDFNNLLTSIFNVIDKKGSKKAFFTPLKQKVTDFFEKITTSVFLSEPTLKYQKRFNRYKQSLFTFLEYDNIPWNNNTAERAIRHLAIQRKISGSFFESSAQDYLILLSIAQTCRFQDKSFLDFLLSKETDIKKFKKRVHIRNTVAVKHKKRDERDERIE